MKGGLVSHSSEFNYKGMKTSKNEKVKVFSPNLNSILFIHFLY